jgi:hypothetical protein
MKITNLRSTQIITNNDANATLIVDYGKGGIIESEDTQISTGNINSSRSDKRHKIINIGQKARGHRLKLTVTGVVSKTKIGCIENKIFHDRFDVIDIDDMIEEVIISGTVTGDEYEGVEIDGGIILGTELTDVNGYYEFTDVPDGTYTLTPTLEGYTFEPVSIEVTVTNSESEIGNDFVSTSEGVVTDYVGYWPMIATEMSGTTVYDKATVANNGTYNGTPTWATDPLGNLNNALTFASASSNRVLIPHHADYVFGTENFSYSFWVRYTGTITGNNFFAIIGKGNNMAAFGHLYRRSSSGNTGTLRSYITSSTAQLTKSVTAAFHDASGVGNGVWHHVAFVRETLATKIYFDGTDITSGSPNTSDIVDTSGMYVGVSNFNSLVYYITGSICHLRLYDRDLSADEVNTIYTAKL